MQKILFILFLISFPKIIFAENNATTTPTLGTYIFSRASGTLKVEKNNEGLLKFAIITFGDNGSNCDVNGYIKGNIGYPTETKANSTCEINFIYAKNQISISAPAECDSYFCGLNAGIDGIYKIPPKECSANRIEARRDELLKYYKTGYFEKASLSANNLISDCYDFINWVEIDRIRNDLALSQYHENKPSACLETLSQTLASKILNNHEDGVYLGSADEDAYREVLKSTKHNKSLCEK